MTDKGAARDAPGLPFLNGYGKVRSGCRRRPLAVRRLLPECGGQHIVDHLVRALRMIDDLVFKRDAAADDDHPFSHVSASWRWLPRWVCRSRQPKRNSRGPHPLLPRRPRRRPHRTDAAHMHEHALAAAGARRRPRSSLAGQMCRTLDGRLKPCAQRAATRLEFLTRSRRRPAAPDRRGGRTDRAIPARHGGLKASA